VRVHLVNPSDLSFGTAVITPRWLYVPAAATPARFGLPNIVDETLEPFEARARLAFLLISKLYRQLYANTGIATDSARVARSARRARWLARAARRLFVAPPMPDLAVPVTGQDVPPTTRFDLRGVS
jgi:hypothetical protein